MKNGDYVIAPLGCAEYLTAGNKYQIFDVQEIKDDFHFRIIDNEGDKLTCLLKYCGHINCQDWILATESEAFFKEAEEPIRIGYITLPNGSIVGYNTHKTINGSSSTYIGKPIEANRFGGHIITCGGSISTSINGQTYNLPYIIDNPISDFLLKNGFKLIEKGVYENDKAKVILYDDYYAVMNFEDNGINYSDNLNIYWLVGYLTYYNLIDKDYKI